MAKMNGRRLNIAIASLLIVIIAWASSGLTSYVGTVHQTGDTAADLVELKDDGCDPSRVNGTAIAVFETKLDNLKEQQHDDTEAILTAIREN